MLHPFCRYPWREIASSSLLPFLSFTCRFLRTLASKEISNPNDILFLIIIIIVGIMSDSHNTIHNSVYPFIFRSICRTNWWKSIRYTSLEKSMANKRLKRLRTTTLFLYPPQFAMVSETSSSSEEKKENSHPNRNRKSQSEHVLLYAVTTKRKSLKICFLLLSLFSSSSLISVLSFHILLSCFFVAKNIFFDSFFFSSLLKCGERKKNINRTSVDNMLQCTLSDFDFPSLFWRRKWDLAIAEYGGTHCETSGSIVRTTNQRCAPRSTCHNPQMTSIECSVSFLM